MDRRAFLRTSALGLGGYLLGGGSLGGLLRQAAAMSAGGGRAWKFGVMADTQWLSAAGDSGNPATCAIEVIRALNREFIRHGVKFVVQVGDLVDKESWDCPAHHAGDPFGNAGKARVRTLPYRAWAAQDLYDAGIGFFPLRGNHESSVFAANEFPQIFPQTTGSGRLYGVSNVIDSDRWCLRGLSYAIDFDNVRIVMIDQFTRRHAMGSANDNVVDQLAWIDKVLEQRPAGMHAFVMAHKNLVGQSRADCLFGASPFSNVPSRDAFIASLQANRVGFCIGGHDHMHHRSIVADSRGGKQVEQLICASNSSKFHVPRATPLDPSERVVAQELFTIGYYIFTVDGPTVTVDFHSSSHGEEYGKSGLVRAPSSYRFFRRERFGYSLNGREFTVAGNEPYTAVQDAYRGTLARILDGVNGDRQTSVDFSARKQVKSVSTGWKEMPWDAASAVFKLWGLNRNLSLWDAGLSGLLPAADEDYVTDTYVLSLSCDDERLRAMAASGNAARVCLAARDDSGRWVAAVDLNAGGRSRFVPGRWKPGYGLGTHGFDPETRTVWAVLNRDGEFVARMA